MEINVSLLEIYLIFMWYLKKLPKNVENLKLYFVKSKWIIKAYTQEFYIYIDLLFTAILIFISNHNHQIHKTNPVGQVKV